MYIVIVFYRPLFLHFNVALTGDLSLIVYPVICTPKILFIAVLRMTVMASIREDEE